MKLAKAIYVFLLLLGLIVVIVVSGCAPLDKYKSNVVKSEIDQAIGEMVVITTLGQIRAKDDHPWAETKIEATAFNIGNGYILALTHATQIPRSQMVRMGPFAVIMDFKVQNERFFIGGQEIRCIGRFEDISLFSGGRNTSAIRWGDSDKLEYGTKVVVLGNSLMKGLNLKGGEISIPKIKAGTFYEYDCVSFLTSAPINPGDSGSPVFARSIWGYELVGIASAKMNGVEGMGLAYKSNYVKRAIKEIQNGEKKGGKKV